MMLFLTSYWLVLPVTVVVLPEVLGSSPDRLAGCVSAATTTDKVGSEVGDVELGLSVGLLLGKGLGPSEGEGVGW